jgi:hypothetical protein
MLVPRQGQSPMSEETFPDGQRATTRSAFAARPSPKVGPRSSGFCDVAAQRAEGGEGSSHLLPCFHSEDLWPGRASGSTRP